MATRSGKKQITENIKLDRAETEALSLDGALTQTYTPASSTETVHMSSVFLRLAKVLARRTKGPKRPMRTDTGRPLWGSVPSSRALAASTHLLMILLAIFGFSSKKRFNRGPLQEQENVPPFHHSSPPFPANSMN